MCSAKNDSLVRYPTVLAPASGVKTVHVQCADNAHQTSPGLTVLCTSSGSWTGAPLCECDTGYHSVTVSGREVCQSKQRKLLNTLFRFSPVSQYKSLLTIIVRLFLNLPPVLLVKHVLLVFVLNAKLQPLLKLNISYLS